MRLTGITCVVFMLISWAVPSRAGETNAAPRSVTDALLPVPEWVHDSIFDLDSGYGEGAKDEAYFQTLAGLGVDVVSSRIRMHTDDVEQSNAFKEQVARVSAAAQKIHRRWFGYFVAPVDQVVVKEHPDWRTHETPDMKLPEATIYSCLCFNSPWRGEFQRKLLDLERQYRPDGFLIDGWNYVSPFCYCDYCKKAYKEATGEDIPLKMDLDDPAYCRWMRWRDRVKVELVLQTRDELRKINPEIALMPWITGPGRWWHMETPAKNQYKYETETLTLLADYPVLEMYWDWPLDQGGTVMADFALRYITGVRRGRPYGASPNCAAHGQQPTRIPKIEEMFRTASIVASGGDAAPTWSWMADREDYRDMMDFIRARRPWTTRAVSRPWAALVSSENTRFYYGRDKLRDKYMFHCLGAFRALQEEHLPFDIMTDLDLEDGGARLDQYKVIVLANTACLSERALANVRGYVERGGGLVATHESSLYNEDGVRRADFGLAGVFGAHFKALEDHSGVWPDEPTATRLTPATLNYGDHPIFADPVIERSFVRHINEGTSGTTLRQTDFFGKGINAEATTGTQVIATRTGATAQDQWPALILSRSGQGRVAYFPGGIDDAYYRIPMAFERRLLTNAVRWAASAPPPVEIEAPLTVSLTCFEQRSGGRNRLVVHLLNEINTLAGRSLPAGSPPQREEIVPVESIRVHFRDRGIRRVTQQPENLPLAMRKVADGIEVTVPVLQIHSMIVAEKDAGQ